MGIDILILLVAGLVGGFIGGLVGVGGGLIFAPVLFFYFQAIGVPSEILAPLTIGTSLFCTLIVSLSATRTQLKKRAVSVDLALQVGFTSAVAALLMVIFVTSQAWYSAVVFQVVFGLLLLLVAVQMSVRIRSEQFMSLGTPVRARFQLESKKVVTMTGKVVWTQKEPYGDYYQIGVEFQEERQSLPARRNIHDYIDQK